MKALIRLAAPMVVTFLAQMLMGVVDLLFVGRVSPEAVGAVGIGNSVFGAFMVLGIGTLSCMDFLVARAIGAGDPEDARRTLGQGVFLALALSLPMIPIIEVLAGHLESFGVDPSVAVLARPYARVMALSLPFVLLFISCRMYLQAQKIARPAMYMLMGANLLNVLVNYIFVFGNWGAPALGSTGSGIATLVSRMAMCGVMFWFLRKIGVRFSMRPQRERLKEMLRIGLPAGGQAGLEVGGFSVATLFAGRLKPIELAAHQITLNVASMTFMVSLGLSASTAVMVGQAVGRRDTTEARHMGWSGILLTVLSMGSFCAVLLLAPRAILGIYTADEALIASGIAVMFFAALFQISDGVQCVATGALRGLGRTRMAFTANLLGHWCVGLPLGYWLCFSRGHGLAGIWIGLAVGLTVVALWLTLEWWRVTRVKVLA